MFGWLFLGEFFGLVVVGFFSLWLFWYVWFFSVQLAKMSKSKIVLIRSGFGLGAVGQS